MNIRNILGACLVLSVSMAVPSVSFASPHTYSCRIDTKASHNCAGAVQILGFEHEGMPQAMVLAKIDAKDLVYMRVTVRYDNPTNWTFDLGNSRTNNGACGDSATNIFDSEIDTQGRVVRVCGDDTDPGRTGLTDLFGATSTLMTYEIFPGSGAIVSSNANPFTCRVDGGGLFQLGGFDTEANAPNDETYWLGLNRVIADTTRRGQGASIAEISLYYR